MTQDLNKTAFTHRSALNENKSLISNERLEFLGDAVLELVVSVWLYQQFPQNNEGWLSTKRSQLVQTQTLAAMAKKLGFDQKLILSKGETKSGGRENESILADCFEAVVGAIYLEHGLAEATEFIKTHLLSEKIDVADYKSQLQENWQRQFHQAPRYKLVKAVGPEHKKTFTVGVFLKNRLIAQGQGLSKQKAEASAAKQALANFK